MTAANQPPQSMPRKIVMSASLSTLAQVAAVLLLSLVAGSVFGIWAGYDLTRYSQATFLEVLQRAVGGLNVLLPALALLSLALVVGLAVAARKQRAVMGLYLAAAAAIAVAGLTTRLVNQPINAEVVTWTLDHMPANWQDIRQTWWLAHTIRLIASIVAEFLLLLAVLGDRRT
jgi:hypothetical protein